ncbi:MAG: hypothetical protein M3N47_05455 [Chloroflexota bacterium]|nr:hypothetical protein [Chloroflexota bacterium]
MSPETKDAADARLAANSGPDEVLTTEVIGSTESYRRLGEVLVSVLAALPSATLLTSLIRAPGDAGLDETKLIAGVVCAAIAVATGVALAIWLRSPVTVNAQELKNEDFKQLVLTSQDNYDELLERIKEAGVDINDAETESERTKAQGQMKALLATLRRLQLVATATKLRKRVFDWRTIALALGSLAFAAAAIALLALAPKPKAADAATTVVEVRLTAEGARLLKCPTSDFKALRVGGTDDVPQVVPLNIECKAGALLELKTAAKAGTTLKVTEAEPVAPIVTVTTPSPRRSAPRSTTP